MAAKERHKPERKQEKSMNTKEREARYTAILEQLAAL